MGALRGRVRLCGFRLRPRGKSATTAVALALVFAVISAGAICAQEVAPPRKVGAVGEPYWKLCVDGVIRQVAVARPLGSGHGKILLGIETPERKGELRVLGADGADERSYLLPAGVSAISIVESPSGNRRLVLVGADDGRLTALDLAALEEAAPDRPPPEPEWSYRTEGAIRQVITAELTSDLSPEVLISSAGGRVIALDERGKLLWDMPTGQEIRGLFVADIYGDGTPEVLVSAGTLYVLSEAGKPNSQLIPIGHLSDQGDFGAVAVGRLDTAGPPKILTGTDRGVIHFGDLTSESWRYAFPGPGSSSVRSLDVGAVEVNKGPQVVVGYEGSLAVLNPDGSLDWTYPVTGIVHEARGILTAKGPAILLRDGEGAAILRREKGATEELRFRTEAPASKVIFDDVNGDGVNELLVATGRCLRLFGYDGGELSPDLRWTMSLALDSLITAVGVGDVHGDGSREPVFGTNDGGVYVAREGKLALPVWRALGSIKAVQLADLDSHDPSRDRADEILVRSDDGKMYAYSLRRGLLWQVVDIPRGAQGLAVADWDDDGTPEVLVGAGDRNLSVYRSNGVLLRTVSFADSVSGTVMTLFAMGDMTGDKFPDLLALSTEGDLYALDSHSGDLIWKSQTPPREDEVAVGDVNGDDRPEALVGSSDGSVYVLSGERGPSQREITRCFEARDSAIKSVATADVDGNGRLEVLAVNRNGLAYAWQVDPGGCKLVAKYATNAGRGALIGGSDADGDGSAEVFVASPDGEVRFFGLTANQPPLLANAECKGSKAGRLLCSADVIDPERDPTKVTLLGRHRTMDDLGKPWEETKTTEIGTSGRQDPGPDVDVMGVAHTDVVRKGLNWDVPFNWWDEGQQTQLTLWVDVGDSPRSIQLPATWVPGVHWGWRVSASLAVFAAGVGFAVKKRRDWVRSRAGTASWLYKNIKKAPERLLLEIGDVVAHRENASEILNELLVLCTREGAWCATGMAEVVQGYQLVLVPDQWEAGLRSLLSGLPALSGVEAQGESLTYCRLLNVASTANSMALIAAMRSQIDAAQPMTSISLPGFSDLKDVLAQWSKFVGHLENYQNTASTEEKIRYLGQSITDLSLLDRQISSGSAFREPERNMLRKIAALWQDIVNNALDELRGRADLRASMPTRRVLALDNVIVALALRNEGSAEAQNVQVELLPSQHYEVLEGDGKLVVSIPAAQSRSVEFRVRPLAEKGFRAEFRITYDDQRSTGRSLAFADQVSLVQVTGEYQPIPNPYYAGRPLDAGSPLFFGREDVFGFIAGNIGGVSRANVLVLIGQRRCGKTSLLKQLPLKLDKRYVPVYIDGQQLGIDKGMANLFYYLSQVIASSLALAGMAVVAPTREEFEPAPSQVFEQVFLARVEAALGDRRLLLTFDEFEAIEARVRDGNVDRTVFPFLRHLMQHSEKLAFVFVGTHKLEELSQDYWSIFFNIALHQDIRFLNNEAARRLIREPVAGYRLVYDDLAVERILDITAGHPYFVQLMCHSLVNFANANRRNFVTVVDVRKVVDETIALGEAHFRWLWDMAATKEQLVLATLTSLLRDQAMATSSAISSALAEQRYPMDPAEVSDILGRLAAQDIVDEIPGHALRYQFKLEIVSLWIRRNRPLSRVIEDVTVREPQRATTESG